MGMLKVRRVSKWLTGAEVAKERDKAAVSMFASCGWPDSAGILIARRLLKSINWLVARPKADAARTYPAV